MTGWRRWFTVNWANDTIFYQTDKYWMHRSESILKNETQYSLGINFYLLRTFCPHLGSFFFVCECCFFFHYISAKFHLWPSSGDLPRPRIGMLSLVTVSPVIFAFHSCCLSHHVFDQVNLWPAWVGFETAIFWQCSPGTVETQRLYPLRHGPRRNFWSYKSLSRLPESGPYRIFVLVFNWYHFEMRLLNLRINFYLFFGILKFKTEKKKKKKAKQKSFCQIHKPESVLENEIHKTLWDFEIQTDHQIAAKRSDLVLITKKNKLKKKTS